MPYIDIHNERVWIPERPLRSMDEARPMRDGDLLCFSKLASAL